MRLSSEIEATIRQIGRLLDQNAEMRIMNGGLVVPSKSTVPLVMGTQETHHVKRKGKARPPTWPRQRAAAGQGSAGRPRATCPPASPAFPNLRERYEAELEAVMQAYPGAQAWPSEDCLFILADSQLVVGLERAAVIVLAISYKPYPAARAWAFWNGLNWIGPRHTNFADGSICAFDPMDDGAWQIGEPLVDLLDLYTLWVFRHLYLHIYGRWPGLQSSPYAWERFLELRSDEFCGCGALPYRLYADCCQGTDRSGRGLRDLMEYMLRGGILERSPPVAICKFARERGTPPAIETVLPNPWPTH